MPTVKGMAADGIPYTGFLYAGLMIDADGHPRVVEFNCRLGDPETQPILMRLKSDLFELVEHAIDGTLDTVEAEWDRRAALGVVLAAAGYPDTPRKGDEITGLPTPSEDCHVFHAGTALHDGKVVTNGGRVLCVTALGRQGEDGAEARLRGVGGSASTACSIGATSATGRSRRAKPDADGRCGGQRLPHRPAGRIVAALERLDGGTFRRDAWKRTEGGGGIAASSRTARSSSAAA